MRINIISIGKLSQDYQAIAKHYTKMTKWHVISSELTYGAKIPENQIKSHEAKIIASNMQKNATSFALDVLGSSYDSHEFAAIFSKTMSDGKDVEFIIGGAYGLDSTILNQCKRISLSKMTLPHQLAKILLLEQIYRAQTIIENHPYHK